MMHYVEKQWEEFNAIKKKPRLRYVHTIAMKSNDPFHIDYKVPYNEVQKWHDLIKFIAQRAPSLMFRYPHRQCGRQGGKAMRMQCNGTKCQHIIKDFRVGDVMTYCRWLISSY